MPTQEEEEEIPYRRVSCSSRTCGLRRCSEDETAALRLERCHVGGDREDVVLNQIRYPLNQYYDTVPSLIDTPRGSSGGTAKAASQFLLNAFLCETPLPAKYAFFANARTLANTRL